MLKEKLSKNINVSEDHFAKTPDHYSSIVSTAKTIKEKNTDSIEEKMMESLVVQSNG